MIHVVGVSRSSDGATLALWATHTWNPEEAIHDLEQLTKQRFTELGRGDRLTLDDAPWGAEKTMCLVDASGSYVVTMGCTGAVDDEICWKLLRDVQKRVPFSEVKDAERRGLQNRLR